MTTTELELASLADRVEGLGGPNNRLDVLAEIALFEPDEDYKAVRANSAGTKAIYTDWLGRDHTHWAPDHTFGRRRASTAAALRARSIQGKE